ncbi:hypothetical protein HPB50_011512 [Hyalomma asiaticum]|uniref:Uncharacterized protein n=1 Tax=Hyalomma asiaticum TaxID=266040 RepID=A0ACB7TID9_HYAAI|nr:hypothetical protein HPB50_011512 [Hyalomma asiaticum]
MVKAGERPSKRDRRKRKREASRVELEGILKAFKESEDHDRSEASDTDSRPVSRAEGLQNEAPHEAPQHDLLKVLEEEIANLKKELATKDEASNNLVQLLEEERERTRRLTDALLSKFEIASSTTSDQTQQQQVTTDVLASPDMPSDTVEKAVAENPSDVPAVKRRANARKALRDLFAEMARLGHRTKCPT